MDRFFPVKKAVETVTLRDLVAAVMFFRCADIFSGKRRQGGLQSSAKECCFFAEAGFGIAAEVIVQSCQTWVSGPLPYFALRTACYTTYCATKTNFQKMVLVVSHLSTRRLKRGLTSEIVKCHRPSPEQTVL